MTPFPGPLLRRFPLARALALLALVAWGAAQAAPAPWYWWRSKIDGARTCAQVSPGDGWERDSGPFDGPGCQPRKRVYVIPMR